jgi:hypothetical protein
VAGAVLVDQQGRQQVAGRRVRVAELGGVPFGAFDRVDDVDAVGRVVGWDRPPPPLARWRRGGG